MDENVVKAILTLMNAGERPLFHHWHAENVPVSKIVQEQGIKGRVQFWLIEDEAAEKLEGLISDDHDA